MFYLALPHTKAIPQNIGLASTCGRARFKRMSKKWIILDLAIPCGKASSKNGQDLL